MTPHPDRVRVDGPLAAHAADFGEELLRRGYPPGGAARHVQLLAHLSRWLDDQGLTGADLTADRVAQFLGARRATGYAMVPSLRWAMTLLGWVPGLVVAPPPPPQETAVGALIDDYRRYLVHERGLATSTVRGYIDTARLFLTRLDRDEGLDLSRLGAAEVTAFVVEECRRRHVGSATALVTGLRSLLRFLSLEGHTTHPLAGAVPAASAMGGNFLPKGLAPDVVDALLASCDSSSLAGRRDFAILTVLSRLGLRAGEVARLELEDFDWHHGELVVRGKGSRTERLPMPADVGEAVVAYLTWRGPHPEQRAVFLRVRAPITVMTTSNVSEIVHRACRRAGMPTTRAHRLRHSAATNMLRKGSSLAEIGQVLRQSRAATTASYAKVDRLALRALGQAWPEVAA
jgi:integrase/recombinase XerD